MITSSQLALAPYSNKTNKCSYVHIHEFDEHVQYKQGTISITQRTISKPQDYFNKKWNLM